MLSRLDRYFRHTKTWRAEKQRLRAILLDFPLEEDLKWRQPCYSFQGANVVILGGFQRTCDLGFFKGSLLDNPHGLLVPPGPHSQASRQLRFTSVEEIEEKEPIIRATIANAIEVERAGLKVDFKQKNELVPVAELLAKMESDPEFRAAFEALTPGRQRGIQPLLRRGETVEDAGGADREAGGADSRGEGHARPVVGRAM